MKILAVRNDRLGDFMLAWPAFQTLHLSLSGAQLSVLAQDYTAPLARLCEGVSEVLCHARTDGELASARALASLVRPQRFDAAVALFSRFDIALGLALARIPMRAAPATKLAQIFYTRRLRQHRSHSLKPEWAYNLELVEFFLGCLGVSEVIHAHAPYLRFAESTVAETRAALCAQLGLDAARPLVVLHAGHGGSSPTPAPEAFARIGHGVVASGASLILSEGPADSEMVQAVSGALDRTPHAVLHSTGGLVDFAHSLSAADLFISGSTGPLHIAGALDVPTAAFYPRRRSASALRWQTLNSAGRRLAYMPPPERGENDFAAIDWNKVVSEISDLLQKAARDRVGVPINRHT